MVLIIALGMVAAGLLSRVVMKIVAVRRGQINVEHLESDWIDNRNQHDSRGDKWQNRRSLNERDTLIDDLHRSLMLGTSDYSAGRAFQVDGERPNSARRTGGSFQVAGEVSEREDKLEQWRRDLDWLLQSSKAV
jgi:hypothetical protein